jgi:hypothetical protein
MARRVHPSLREVHMNRKILSSVLSVLLLGGTATFADDKSMEKTDEKTTTAGATEAKDHIVVGTVKEFEAGKELKILVGKEMRSFALDAKDVNTSVDPAVAVGGKVKVVESKVANGIKTLTVIPTS